MKINWSRLKNRHTVFMFDCTMILVAWFGAYWLRFNLDHIPGEYFYTALLVSPLLVTLQVLSYLFFGLYRGDWQYASMPDLKRILSAVFIGSMGFVLCLFVIMRISGIPRSVVPLYALLLTALLGGARFGYRWLRERTSLISHGGKRVLIIGAGRLGESLARELLRDSSKAYYPVAFVDDNKNKIGRDIHGIRVYSHCDDIDKIAADRNAELAIIAIASLNASQLRRLVEHCEQANIEFCTVPNFHDVAAGKVKLSSLQPISIEDLLGREPVSLNWQQIRDDINEHTILISGAGGSIGSEITKQIASLQAKRIILLENNEFNLYQLEQRLSKQFPALNFEGHLVDVCDDVAVNYWMGHYQPDIVFHAAAYKHVPLLENQVRIAVQNNLIGTKTIAEAAVTADVKQFVLISTDKVVNPSNVMGATKRAAEIFCQQLNRQSNTQFITVRFGNVMGSTGSVIPLFKQQLGAGGPLTVTHPEATRYFMTIPEASQLILQAAAMGKGGEIFVLDMGKPIKIRYLAEQMIQLSGFVVGKDIDIIYTGLRPGEKLHETLFHEHEKLLSTSHKKILLAQHRDHCHEQISFWITLVEEACQQYQETRLMQLLHELIPEFKQGASTPRLPQLKVVS